MKSRLEYTKRNIAVSSTSMIIQAFFSFVSRSVIIYCLGSKYLGLSSLFSSILMVLNVAELGFTSSIVYFMYKPIAENDVNRVCSLLAYLKKVYRLVGLAILVCGILSIPILPKLISGNTPSDINIYILYILYLINTSSSYFLSAHKTALLTAIQRLDLTKVVSIIAMLVQYILQFISLLFFKNYYLFVISMIIGTILTNALSAYLCDKKYPQYKCKGVISSDDKRAIWHKIRGLLVCNISIVTYSTLDSIVLSAYVGLISVAMYSNYMTIYKAINQCFVMVRASMQSSVGNSVACESKRKNLHDLMLWQFIFSFLATWCSVCMLCLYQPFMSIWMGEKLLLPFIDVILLVVWFSFDIVQQAQNLYIQSTGLWNEMKLSYIFNTICNLLLNVILGKYLGVAGILIASLVTCIISGTFWQVIILFKNYFGCSSKEYIINYFKYLFWGILIAVITFFVCFQIKSEGLIELFFKGIICIIVPFPLLYVIYRNNPIFKEAKSLLQRMIF